MALLYLLSMLPLWLVVGIRIPTAPTRLSRAAAYALSFACLTAAFALIVLNFLMSVSCVGPALLVSPLLALALVAGLEARVVRQAGGQAEARLLYVLLGLTLLLAGIHLLEPPGVLATAHPLCAGQNGSERLSQTAGFLTEAAKGVLPPCALLALAFWQERRVTGRSVMGHGVMGRGVGQQR